ncbi:MAG TPA: hypothetical protein VIG62_07585 [Blastocatellia bacterium]|jgi:hypothetical protein
MSERSVAGAVQTGYVSTGSGSDRVVLQPYPPAVACGTDISALL